jgi:hypothetical protein
MGNGDRNHKLVGGDGGLIYFRNVRPLLSKKAPVPVAISEILIEQLWLFWKNRTHRAIEGIDTNERKVRAQGLRVPEVPGNQLEISVLASLTKGATVGNGGKKRDAFA